MKYEEPMLNIIMLNEIVNTGDTIVEVSGITGGSTDHGRNRILDDDLL